MRPVSLVDLGSYLPDAEIGLEFFFGEDLPDDPMSRSPVFKQPTTRRHVAPGDRAAEMIRDAAAPMFARRGIDPAGNVDVLITNVLLPDALFTGCGAETAELLGCTPEWIIDLHNGGCASFPYMLKLARTIIGSGQARTALVCNVQNAAGQVFAQPGVRTSAHAAAPGDGCGVAYLTEGGHSPILGVETRNSPGFAMDLGPATSDGRKFWEPGAGELDVRFAEEKTAEIIARGNALVPEMVTDLCKRIDLSPDDIDVLITNQPNRIFLRTWRDALGLEPERHLDTFDALGNLYGAGAPVTFAQAVRDGQVRDGDLVVVAGFAHAGDFAAAAAVRWNS
ncbi:3-oxoacyl-ACP synthase [Actinophytocola xinjiangensis]|uniref:3-oxoacyl-ACP synthase n=1 Tax=Actinophytocola xinjiangensis TaxID=485602 RepID=A0A7Z0WLR9_9PSEU|nr:3-oxoacyl-[acyl-carrier-protein] synthase III C-terminal domain-containing protein [Actinophytocola xinjiangensis]OLF10440.1 3-oxoacyl-ACP synthase [Actinophytocola xinjiangensis]